MFDTTMENDTRGWVMTALSGVGKRSEIHHVDGDVLCVRRLADI